MLIRPLASSALKWILALTLVAAFPAAAADEGACSKLLDRKAQPDRQVRKQALASIRPFKGYLESLKGSLLEREYLIDTAALALLAEEHLLLMGPPGNAKSMLADSILGNIKESSGNVSYFRLQMTPETTLSETHGPLDFKTLNETGRYERILGEGMLYSRNVFVDEIFDARANALRNILGLLNERAHAQGIHITKGNIETAFAATNKYISEVYEKAGDDSPKAVLDRFAFTAFVPGEFVDTNSYVQLIQGAKRSKSSPPTLTFEELEGLRALLPQVEINEGVAKFLALLSTKMKDETEALEQSSLKNYRDRLKNGEEPGVPYRSTKYHSPRTLGKAAGILRALVVFDWIQKNGRRRLEANLDDVRKLESFFTLNGPESDFINKILERTSNPHERAQLSAILQEREIFDKYYEQVLSEVNEVLIRFTLHDLQAEAESAKTKEQKESASKKILEMILSLEEEVDRSTPHSAKTGRDIGIDLVREEYRKILVTVLGNDIKASEILDRIEQQRKALIAERMRKEQAERREAERQRRIAEAKVAAEKAREEAAQKAAEEAKQKLLASFAGRRVTMKEALPLSSTSQMKQAVHESGLKVALMESESTQLHVIQLAEKGGGSKTTYDINLSEAFDGQDVQRISFIDENRILFEDPNGTAAVVFHLDSQRQQEILLGRAEGKTAFHRKSDTLFQVTKTGTIVWGKLNDGARERKELSFDSSEAKNQWTEEIETYGIQNLLISEDGKVLTVVPDYGKSQFFISVEKIAVVGTEPLLEVAENLQQIPGAIGRVNQQLVLTSVDKTKVAVKAIDIAPDLQGDISHGVHIIDENTILLGSDSGLKVWDVKTGGSIAVGGEPAQYASNPIVLADGRILVLGYDSTWKIFLLE